MTTSTRKDIATLNLVQCEDYWFPVARKDLLLLREHQITAARIPARTLPTFKHLFLTDVLINELAWENVSQSLLEHFGDTLKDRVPTAILKHADDAILVALPWDDDGTGSTASLIEEMTSRSKKLAIADSSIASPNEQREAQLQKHFKQLQRYLGQYSFAVSINRQDQTQKLGAMVYRVSWRFNQELNNAIFYESIPNAPTVQTLDLGTDFRLKFAIESIAEREKLSVYAEDRMNGNWQTHMHRSFDRKQMTRENIGTLVDFLIAHYL